jgi:hypothetical protein
MTTRTMRLPAALAGMLIGGAMLAPLPAAAQRDGAARDPLERPGQVDLNDRYPSQYPYGRPPFDRSAAGSGGPQEDRRAGAERAGRDAFERGYRAGREAERQRSSAPSGGRADIEHYWYVPDILPDTPRYRGMQDFALLPDYSRQMDRMMIAAQSLREAIQAAAQLPANERRNQAIDRLHEALRDTQQAMVLLPPEARQR